MWMAPPPIHLPLLSEAESAQPWQGRVLRPVVPVDSGLRVRRSSAWQSLDARQRDWARAMACGQSCEALGLACGLLVNDARAQRTAIFQCLHVKTVLELRALLAFLGELA